MDPEDQVKAAVFDHALGPPKSVLESPFDRNLTLLNVAAGQIPCPVCKSGTVTYDLNGGRLPHPLRAACSNARCVSIPPQKLPPLHASPPPRPYRFPVSRPGSNPPD